MKIRMTVQGQKLTETIRGEKRVEVLLRERRYDDTVGMVLSLKPHEAKAYPLGRSVDIELHPAARRVPS